MTAQRRFNPFPGLRSFEPDEDHLFFGREKQVDDLLGRLRRTRFLAVVGTSGSGKSSLVRSGLIPSLHSGFMVEGGLELARGAPAPRRRSDRQSRAALNAPGVLGADRRWRGQPRRCSKPPCVAARSASSMRRARRACRRTTTCWSSSISSRSCSASSRPRAESRARDEAVAFVKLLLEARDSSETPIYVVLTMRSEFIGDCAEFPGLAEAINDGQYLVPRMTARRAAARRSPARSPSAAAEIAPRLVHAPAERRRRRRGSAARAAARADADLGSLGSAPAPTGAPSTCEDYEAIGTMKRCAVAARRRGLRRAHAEREPAARRERVQGADRDAAGGARPAAAMPRAGAVPDRRGASERNHRA